MITVAQCFDIQQAQKFQMALQAVDIASFIPDEFTAQNAPWYFTGSATGVRLQVAEEHAETARAIIEQARNTSAHAARFISRSLGFGLLAAICLVYAVARLPMAILVASGLGGRGHAIGEERLDWVVVAFCIAVAALGIFSTRRYLFWRRKASEAKPQGTATIETQPGD